MFGANSTQHITEYHYLYFKAWWWLQHVMGMLIISSKIVGIKKKIKAKQRQCP
jgi:hypothetical protein